MTIGQVHELKRDVTGVLRSKVEDIFIDFQNALGVESGDIEPLAALELQRREEELAGIIADVLVQQKGEW